MAISGLGTGIGITLAETTHTYATVISVAVVGRNCDVIDVSSSGSADQCSDYLPGLLNSGDLVVTLRYAGTRGATAPLEPGYLETLYNARTVSNWTLTLPGGATGGTYVGYGFIKNLGPSVHYRGSAQQQLRIKFTGKVTYTVAA